MHPLPQRLAAPDPGWTRDADVVVVGSGVAGLTVALGLARTSRRVLLVTKARLDDGSTRWAQGGVAAALDPADTPDAHREDTLTAGAGVGDQAAIDVLVREGPSAVRDLIDLGAAFDTLPSGALALTREGGHHHDRVAHAGGDATGAEVSRALLAAVRAEPRVEVIAHAFVLDLLTDDAGRAAGITLHVMGEGRHDGVGAVRSAAVVLATGGFGQVYAATTNPSVSTGDGVALALRAGARATDLEFVQFHPTVMWLGDAATGQQPLVTEALRGAGARLVDAAGTPFMTGVHDLADLAPRDVVAKAILRRMAETGADHVFLDATHLGADVWRRRFPTVLASCRAHGIDPLTEPIPVVPAAHYAGGGVRTDTYGRTDVPGLYACGEVARTGVHGANRLASNSLLEGLVFGRRIAAELAAGPGEEPGPVRDTRAAGLVSAEGGAADRVRAAMSTGAGVLRGAASLAATERELDALAATPGAHPGLDTWEATNLVTVAGALVAAARLREETRGSHWREDFPDPDGAWRGQLDTTLRDGRLTVAFTPYDTRTDAVKEPGMNLPDDVAKELAGAGLDAVAVAALVRTALAEDLADGTDVTSAATIPAGQIATADVVARADGVVAGLIVARAVVALSASGRVTAIPVAADGDRVAAGDRLLTLTGPTRDLLTAERTALNMLTHLSGIATATRQWVDAVAGTGAAIRDTRKTLPGLRALEKHAVRCGGGVNHRMSLSDAALIKDNHVLAAGGVAGAFRAVRNQWPDLPVEVECDTLDEVDEAVRAGADLVLLDNMAPELMRAAVARVGGRARLEASGGLHLSGARDVAETGIDYLSVGALTHSAPALDIALDLRMPDRSD
ncbi:MAG TPA: L-aspartate oxidase [Streptosporangiaceae bacterium]|jgi:nicotinate-nucleotide pyrophosphorylase (carboxylating)